MLQGHGPAGFEVIITDEKDLSFCRVLKDKSVLATFIDFEEVSNRGDGSDRAVPPPIWVPGVGTASPIRL